MKMDNRCKIKTVGWLFILFSAWSAKAQDMNFPHNVLENIWSQNYVSAAQSVIKPVDKNDYIFYFIKALLYSEIIENVNNSKNNINVFISCLDTAEMLIRNKGNDSDTSARMQFYLGAIYGWRAKQYLLQDEKWATIKNARKSKTYLQKTLEIDSTWYDAYYGLGLYHYYVATLPKFLSLALPILGLKGNSAKGIRELNIAYHKGVYTKVYAEYELARIYYGKYFGIKTDTIRGFPLVLGLRAKYPKNTNLMLLNALYLCVMQQYKEAEILLDSLDSVARNNSLYSLRGGKKAEYLFWEGIVKLRLDNYPGAEWAFRNMLAEAEHTREKSSALYYLGWSLEKQNNTVDAFAAYKGCLDQQDYYGIHEKAGKAITRLTIQGRAKKNDGF